MASDGTNNIMSGWSNKISKKAKKDFHRENGSLIKAVRAKAQEIGYKLKDHARDIDFEGQYNASHAEKQLSTFSDKTIFGVTKNMCPDCQEYFKALSKKIEKDYIIKEPDAVRIFTEGKMIHILNEYL